MLIIPQHLGSEQE